MRAPYDHTAARRFLLTLAGCSDDSAPVSDGRTLDEVMALARPTLDETSGVQLDLEADGLPAGVNAMSDAEGVGTHPPAFDGVLTVMLGAQAFEVPVISVDDVVYAQLPLVPGVV